MKRYIYSSLITFLSSFLGSLVLFLDSAQGWGDMGLKAVLMACLFTAVRATVKYLNELLLDR